MVKKQYFCTVFFMVLDLRLNEKIGLSGDNLLFFVKKEGEILFSSKKFAYVKKKQYLCTRFSRFKQRIAVSACRLGRTRRGG